MCVCSANLMLKSTRADTLAPVSAMNGWKRYISVILCAVGSQAFQSASAFNANIGAWNTARVTTLESVCAAFGPGGAPPRAAAC